ncbi:sigma54 specific transcriptional regulator, Fis family [Ectothiorhodosinus mongolicus]|uniref:Sigma54 specific transcriptional regulator, Fis family n=2 Tax=Ectothiorhodosinus mongolicus TaxID=233100 RepID=A0A1R3VTJ1_9GAMM|nr:sigma54 specific transcriptional regulator, Fis family [Ectothiorhodosinus mongolicus]
MSSTPDLDSLVALVPRPFALFDAEHRLLAANQLAADLLGHALEDLAGMPCKHFFTGLAGACDGPESCSLHRALIHGSRLIENIQNDRLGGPLSLHLRVIQNQAGYLGVLLEAGNSMPAAESQLVGRSEAMQNLMTMIERVAPTQATVLLLGESGVGKERAADHLHRHSRRVSGPLVVVDCSTLGENLIEAELFGYEKGAFTGADRRKIGLFEAAEGGTLFIDEVGEMPLAMQSKLLRALETSRIRRLGGTDYIAVDARVIAATHRDLAAMVQQGQFREDLFYRLSAFPIQIPPLRERPDDILALAEHFLQHSEAGDAALPLGPEVCEMLLGYQFPGNVRELKNIISRAAILADNGPLRPEHIAFQAVRRGDIDISAGRIPRSRNRLSTERILAVLQACDGHRSEAARQLGISERTLYRHLQKIPEY